MISVSPDSAKVEVVEGCEEDGIEWKVMPRGELAGRAWGMRRMLCGWSWRRMGRHSNRSRRFTNYTVIFTRVG